MSLLRTAARTAVITGTATRVHHRTAAKQQAKWAAGVLTEAEFEAQKARILAS